MEGEIRSLFAELGLSSKEVSCYLVLLRSGPRSISFVAKKAHLNRGTTYLALHSLLEKGLLSKSTQRRVIVFEAQPPSSLLHLLDRRELELRAQRGAVQRMMGSLLALANPLAGKPKVQLFEGVEGCRTAFELTLGATEPLLRAFLSIDDVAQFLGEDFFDDYTNRRIRGGYVLRAIRTQEKDQVASKRYPKTARYQASAEDRREVRYIQDNLSFSTTVYLFDSSVLTISPQDEGFALLIQSDELSSFQKNLFDFTWQTVGAMDAPPKGGKGAPSGS